MTPSCYTLQTAVDPADMKAFVLDMRACDESTEARCDYQHEYVYV